MSNLIVDLRAIKPRETIVYHTGLLANDRTVDPNVGMVAGEAWKLHTAHRAELTQRRLPDGVYQYRATGKISA